MNRICENCMNWESPLDGKLTGMNRNRNQGYCTLFNKEANRNHGRLCPGFEAWPDEKKHNNDSANHG